MAELDYLSAVRELIKSEMIDVNTSINGEIVSYANGIATVKPLANKQFKDNESLPFPIIYNVPVRFPNFNNGQCGFKAPIKQGDKVLLIFSQQSNENNDDLRRFDLNDCYAIPAHNSQVAGGSNNTDTIMYFGAASIRITANGKIILTAPAGVEFNAPINTINGNFATFGTITNNSKSIGSTHTHSGVQAGGGNTGAPL